MELRANTGVLEARKKDKVKFKVRSADELIDKIRDKSNELGLLIYPGEGSWGKAHPVEDGTLAEVSLNVYVQALSDGSILRLWGYGLGADGMDKAGGKAGTYAFKQALVQGLLAGGTKNAKALGVADTDDEGEPIKGGVKQKVKQVNKPSTSDPNDLAEEFDAIEEGDVAGYEKLKAQLKGLSKEALIVLKEPVVAAKLRAYGPPDAVGES